MKTFISLMIVVALALFSLWLQDLFKETPIVRLKKDEHFPDYFLENFTITRMNEDGQPAYILEADRLEHFADDDTADLLRPVIEFRGNADDWTISARRATIMPNRTVIHLYDNVKVRRQNPNNRRPLSIDTDYLKINTESKIAETDRPAHLKMDNMELDTIGMVFDNSQGILKLNSDVKGSYAPAN